MYFIKQIRRTPVKTIFFLILIIIITCLMALGILMNIKSKSEIKNVNKNFFADVKVENIDYVKESRPYTEDSITVDEISNIIDSKYVSHNYIEKKLVAISDNLLAFHGKTYQLTFDIYNMSVFEIEIISDGIQSTYFLSERDGPKNNYGYRYRAKILNVMYGVEDKEEIDIVIDSTYDKDAGNIFQSGKKYIVCARYLKSDMGAKYHHGESKAYEINCFSYYSIVPVLDENKSKNYGVYEIKGDNYKFSNEYKNYQSIADACYYADREQNVSYLSCTNDASIFRNHSGVITNGRDITTEEYEKGKHVCLVSNSYYCKNRLKLGDKIKLKLRDNKNNHVDYENAIDNIDDTKKFVFGDNEYTYEIVGVYVNEDFSFNGPGNNFTANTIYVPEKTFPKELKNTYQLKKCSPLQLSIRLKNYKYKTDFMLDLDNNNFNFDKYNVIVETNGAEDIYDTFSQMEQTSNILLISCLVISIIVLFFIVFLFISKRKTEMAVMTALGTKRIYIKMGFLLSVIVIVLIGTIIGTVLGFNLGKIIVNLSYEKLRTEMAVDMMYSSLYNNEFVYNNFRPIETIPFYLPLLVFMYNIVLTLVMAIVAIKVNLNKEPIVLLTIKEN